jgi:hypothetical protein
MKQAQKMQSQMMSIQEQLEKETVEGAAGGGMVKVTMNGKQELLSVKIDQQVVDPHDIEMLEDLVLAAVNQAQQAVAAKANEKMGPLAGGMNIPGLM